METSLSVVTAVLSSTFLFLVSSLQTQIQVRTKVLGFSVLLVFFVVTSYSIKPLFQIVSLRDNTTPERISLYNILKFREVVNIPKNVILITGGSHSRNGINGELLQEILQSQGYTVFIIQLTDGALNHIERSHIIKNFFNHLSSQEKYSLAKSNLVVMDEVSYLYDQNPFTQFSKVILTDRAYAYLNFSNAYNLYRAELKMRGISGNKIQLKDLLVHSVISQFNIGLFSRVNFEKNLKPIRGYKFGKTKEGFTFDQVRYEDGVDKIAMGKLPPINWLNKIEWVAQVRKNRLETLFSPYSIRSVFHSVPQVGFWQLGYSTLFCQKYSSSQCIDSTSDIRLLRKLDSAQCWKDSIHLSVNGAKIYTKWLAQRLIDNQVLMK